MGKKREPKKKLSAKIVDACSPFGDIIADAVEQERATEAREQALAMLRDNFDRLRSGMMPEEEWKPLQVALANACEGLAAPPTANPYANLDLVVERDKALAALAGRLGEVLRLKEDVERWQRVADKAREELDKLRNATLPRHVHCSGCNTALRIDYTRKQGDRFYGVTESTPGASKWRDVNDTPPMRDLAAGLAEHPELFSGRRRAGGVNGPAAPGDRRCYECGHKIRGTAWTLDVLDLRNAQMRCAACNKSDHAITARAICSCGRTYEARAEHGPCMFTPGECERCAQKKRPNAEETCPECKVRHGYHRSDCNVPEPKRQDTFTAQFGSTTFECRLDEAEGPTCRVCGAACRIGADKVVCERCGFASKLTVSSGQQWGKTAAMEASIKQAEAMGLTVTHVTRDMLNAADIGELAKRTCKQCGAYPAAPWSAYCGSGCEWQAVRDRAEGKP